MNARIRISHRRCLVNIVCIALLVVGFVCGARNAWAAQVTVAWDPNPPAEQATYEATAMTADRLHLPTDPILAVTGTTATFDVATCKKWWFAVRAKGPTGRLSEWTDRTNDGEEVVADFTGPQHCGPTKPGNIRVTIVVSVQTQN